MCGWIKIHRKITEWEWYTDNNTRSLFLHLLVRANFEDDRWQGIEIKRGSFVTGRFKLAEETGLTEQQVRTALKKLENTGEILIKSTNRFSVITICNYCVYQAKEDIEQPTNNQQITNKQPTDNQQITTSKNIRNKEVKKERNKKNIYAPSVSLTEDEYGSLLKEHGEDLTKKLINKLSGYKEQSGKTYKSDMAAIRNWVVKAVKEEEQKNGSDKGYYAHDPDELRNLPF